MKIKIDVSKMRIISAMDVYEVIRVVLKKNNEVDITKKEYMWVIALDASSRILTIELVSTGSISSAIVTPKEILSIPMQQKAWSIVLIHNHPSGEPLPSANDEKLTDHLIQACRMMSTPVWDHVIITQNSYYSFKEAGLLEKLEKSNRFLSSPELERKIRNQVRAEYEKILASRDDQVTHLIEKHRKQLERNNKRALDEKNLLVEKLKELGAM